MTAANSTPAPLDLKAALFSLVQQWPKIDAADVLSARLAERPARNTLVMLGLGAFLFYRAERDWNPKVNTIYDALEYCSSSLSVGYTNIIPLTPMGKLVATLLMTYGPAMSSAITEGPKEPTAAAEPDPTQQKIVDTLEQILAELRR